MLLARKPTRVAGLEAMAAAKLPHKLESMFYSAGTNAGAAGWDAMDLVLPPRQDGPGYAALMLGIYSLVAATCLPNFMATRVPLPSNLHFKAWHSLVHIADNARVVKFLKFGFPMGFEGLVPTLAADNHSSTHNHLRDG